MNLNFKIEFDIAGLIVDVIILLIIQRLYGTSSKNNRRFVFFLLICIASGFMDIVTAFTISNAQKIPPLLNMFFNNLYLFLAVYTVHTVHGYLVDNIKYSSKLSKALARGVLCFFAAMLVVNAVVSLLRWFGIVDFVFLFDFVWRNYNRGTFFILNFVTPLYYFFHVGYLLIFKKNLFTAKQRLLNSSMLVFPLIAVVIQIAFPTYLLTFFSYSMFTLVILFSIETPDFEELEYLRKNLEKEVALQTAKAHERQRKIQKLSIEIVETLAQAIDEKDKYTNGHSKRVSEYSVLVANELAWTPERIENLRVAALLHDVGKIGIPDDVLQKPSCLTDTEFEVIKTHTLKGGSILQNVSSLPIAASVAKHHHERYDGKGYPDHIAGNEISEYARIVSIADAYDAMNSKRVYRDGLPRELIRQRLFEGRGTQFDPDYLDVFLTLFDLEIL